MSSMQQQTLLPVNSMSQQEEQHPEQQQQQNIQDSNDSVMILIYNRFQNYVSHVNKSFTVVKELLHSQKAYTISAKRECKKMLKFEQTS